MTADDGKSVVKAAKKALKKTDGGAGKKLSDLVSAVAKKTKIDAADVAAFIRGSKKFTVVGSSDDGMVALSKKRGPDTPAPVADEGKPKKEKSKKQKRSTVEDDANDNEVATPEVSSKKPLAPSEVPAWRLKHKINILPTVEGDDADNLQQDSKFFPFPTFASCQASLGDALVKHCTGANSFQKPSPIQAQAWPILVKGKDLVGIAETGSGKTLAFALPALSKMSAEPKPRDPRMLVLAPTRELAMQSEAVLSEFGAVIGLRSITIYGGVPKHTQAVELKNGGIDCIVGTPGRLKDFINDGTCRLKSIKFLVLDEADRLLDMGFEEDVRYIVSQTEKRGRQTSMFTATWPSAIKKIAMEFMTNPIRLYVGFESVDDVAAAEDSLSANKRVEQKIEVIEDRQRGQRLRELLRKVHDGKNRVLVFALYKKEAEHLEYSLRKDGFNCCSIHGNKQQNARTEALAQFKDGSCPLMIATDVAARGLDIPDVSAVINYTFPLTIEDFVHRCGRTGRAGKTGIAYTFFQPSDKAHAGGLQQILRQANQPVPDELAKFGNTIKKKEHKLYGNFGPKTGPMKTATKIVFD